MGLIAERGKIFLRIIPDFSNAAGIKKHSKRKLTVRELVAGCPTRTRGETRSPICALGSGESPDNRGFARLHFPKQPDDWRGRLLAEPHQCGLQFLVVQTGSKNLVKSFSCNTGTVLPPHRRVCHCLRLQRRYQWSPEYHRQRPPHCSRWLAPALVSRSLRAKEIATCSARS